MPERTWVLQMAQTEGVYHLGWWRRSHFPSSTLGAGDGLSLAVDAYGSLEQFDALARSILQDIAAIRAQEERDADPA